MVDAYPLACMNVIIVALPNSRIDTHVWRKGLRRRAMVRHGHLPEPQHGPLGCRHPVPSMASLVRRLTAVALVATVAGTYAYTLRKVHRDEFEEPDVSARNVPSCARGAGP
jgi:hypothetical protein